MNNTISELENKITVMEKRINLLEKKIYEYAEKAEKAEFIINSYKHDNEYLRELLNDTLESRKLPDTNTFNYIQVDMTNYTHQFKQNLEDVAKIETIKDDILRFVSKYTGNDMYDTDEE